MQHQRHAGAVAAESPSLFAGYEPPPGLYDELIDSSGAPRPPWSLFAGELGRLGSAEVDRRWSHSQRLIYENGVAYGAPGLDADRPRPWSLDPIPLLLDQQEWRTISAGLEQRARLLELVLRDLYGEQALLCTGVLPPELIYSHPGFLPPFRARNQAGIPERMLRLYAADLGRSPDGQWWVLADRTEAPSGVGFALENRIVVSRMLPELFRDCHVRRLASYFLRLREQLETMAPNDVRNPRIAMLSQGPGQPNYFEDAYLARYLGYTLVEGEDLTVRSRKLWLKTLEGLAKIDVLVRRPNTEHCDPLELGGEAPTGVAGLIQAARDGNVAVANTLGSGLVESPGFMAFMPRLCQHLLGEELLLPCVATWWCGQQQPLEYVLENLDQLILKRAFRKRSEESLLAAELRALSRDDLISRIRRDPHLYCAQERVERSSAPMWRDGNVVPARIALRAFAVAAGDTFSVLSGALARTTPSAEPLESSIRSGEGSKDVWIVGDEPVERTTLLTEDDAPMDLARVGPELPSRVADHSYWLGRHMERADAQARLVRTVSYRLTGEGGPSELLEMPPLLRALVVQGQIEPGYVVDELRDLLPHVEQSLPLQVLNRWQPGSLAATLDRIFNAASQVRDRLSRDTWRILLRVGEALRQSGDETIDLTDLINHADRLIVDLAALGGIVTESMTRTQFYRFLDIGRRVERSMRIVDLLRATLIDSHSCGPPLLDALLETSESLMTYRSRYRANLRFAAVLDLLVTDASNPRSLAFQLDGLERHVDGLPPVEDDSQGTPREQRIAHSMAQAVRAVDVEAIAEAYERGEPELLAMLLAQIGGELPAMSEAISLKYLVHASPPRQLAPL